MPTAPDSHMKTQGVTGLQLVTYAEAYQGTPYKWGGNTPTTGFDCSGFVKWVYAHFGIALPRVSQDQAKTGVAVGINDLQIGDIVFFNTEGPNTHEGLFLGGGKFIHAPHTGDVVKISNLSGYYVDHFSTGRRILKTGGGTTSGTPAPGNPGAQSAVTTVSRGGWANTLLLMMGLPASKNNLISIITWETAEGTKAGWNPLATTQPYKNATNFNSVGVKNYKTEMDGYHATITTLRNGRYAAILADLAKSADPAQTMKDVAASPWGTGQNAVAALPGVQKNYQAAYQVKLTPGTGGQGGSADTEGLPGPENPLDAASGAISGISDAIKGFTDLVGKVFSIRGLEVLGGIAVLGAAGVIIYMETKP